MAGIVFLFCFLTYGRFLHNRFEQTVFVNQLGNKEDGDPMHFVVFLLCIL